MDAWHKQIATILQALFGPSGEPLFAVLIAVGVVTYLFVLHLLSSAFDFRRTDLPQVLVATGIGCAVLLLSVAAAAMYVPHGLVSAQWIRPVATGTVLLAVVTPMYCIFLKTDYVRMLSAISLSVLASVLVAFCVRTATTAVADGKHNVNPARQRKRELETLVD